MNFQRYVQVYCDFAKLSCAPEVSMAQNLRASRSEASPRNCTPYPRVVYCNQSALQRLHIDWRSLCRQQEQAKSTNQVSHCTTCITAISTMDKIFSRVNKVLESRSDPEAEYRAIANEKPVTTGKMANAVRTLTYKTIQQQAKTC